MNVEKFVAWSDAAGFVPPDIVIQYDPAKRTGADWSELLTMHETDSNWYGKPLGKLRDAVEFLLDAVEKMTGQTLSVRSSADLSHGIVFTTLAGATPDIGNDPKVRAALAVAPAEPYGANEAYYVRTGTDRTVLVANTTDGLVNAAAELAESVGYHVLGMGPNWVDVPDHSQSLVFDTERSGRPGYYLRRLWPTSAQATGHGTIFDEALIEDPADETVAASFQRWRVGARLTSQSVPIYPGHALGNYHHQVAAHIRETGVIAGFLAPTHLGPDEDRPARPPSAGHLWINDDEPPAAGAGKVYTSTDTGWVPGSGVSLDVSVPKVRELVFEGARTLADSAFKSWPDAVAQLAIEPEDGGPSDEAFDLYRKNPNWFPEYLEQRGLPFGRPYKLDGHFDLDQPNELWDPKSQSDALYGFALWMLHEYDRWIDALPADQQLTRTGASKKALIRASFLSYSYHDVPPNFNIDSRVRVMISGSSPKHRGKGKWIKITADTHGLDMFEALRVWLDDPGAYHVLSNAGANDWGLAGLPVPPGADFTPATISDTLSTIYHAGVRARQVETDFNFGKFGLGYYLMAKKMWNPAMSAADLAAVRDQWLQRAYGSAWRAMKKYYDYMLVPKYPGNTPSTWGAAIQLVTEADLLIDPTIEPAAKQRIDDLKQYWYFYFLCDTDPMHEAAEATREFVWKGQMSYMNAMYALMKNVYGRYDPAAEAGPTIAAGAAHYSPAETADWWKDIRNHWPATPTAHSENG